VYGLQTKAVDNMWLFPELLLSFSLMNPPLCGGTDMSLLWILTGTVLVVQQYVIPGVNCWCLAWRFLVNYTVRESRTHEKLNPSY